MYIFITYLFLMVLICLGQQDLSTKSINSFLLFPFWCIATVLHWQTCLLIGISYLCVLYLNQLNQQRWIGNGDLDVLACGLCLTPNLIGFSWLNCACLIQLALQALFYRERQAPFVPSLSISWALTVIYV
ncbi:hypothetical protein D3P96_07115 [Weissella viridescens]|uniref:Prepilin peptidase n=1 Tax=Weissella viridescens TaxID=1629 RepID=A0A3P2RJD1_WEIVI|nr:hypothetical protein D3P96_07115 [Weissella viridescens]